MKNEDIMIAYPNAVLTSNMVIEYKIILKLKLKY